MRSILQSNSWNFAILVATTFTLGLTLGSKAYAEQGSGNGRPFISLQEQIDVLSLSLSEAVDMLQADIDSLQAGQSTQNDLIAALESAVATLEQRADETDADISALEALQNMQGQLIAALQDSVSEHEQRLSNNETDIAALMVADQDLHILVNNLKDQINVINSRIDANDGDITTLQIDLEQAQNDLADAEAQLVGKQDLVQNACPSGSSIRQIFGDGSVVCETDDIGNTGTLNTVISSDTVPILSSIFLLRSVRNDRACPSGYLATGGGYGVSSNLGLGNTYINQPRNKTTWRTTALSDSVGTRDLTTYVVCARL